MSSVEVEIHLSDKDEAFVIRVKMDDPNAAHMALNGQAAALVAGFIDQVGKKIK